MRYLLLLLAGLCLHVAASGQGCTTNYVQPDFQIDQTNPSCAGNNGRIEVTSQTGGVGPFTYKLVELNVSNTTGVFTGLSQGLYTVELRDACGTVRARQVTLVPWSFTFTYTVTKTSSCHDGEIVITVNPLVPGVTYGVATGTDTAWSSSSTINIKLKKQMSILVKDPCGNTQVQYWNAPPNMLPYIDALQYRLQCDKFDLFPVYHGFQNPQVCLYEFGSKTLVACKTAPGNYTGGSLTNFFDVPWGQYYVIVSDACFRDSMFHPDMRSSGGSELNPYNWDCTTFTMHVDGPAPPASFYAANPTIPGHPDSICLFNATTNQLISCKPQDTVTINPRTGLPWPSGAVWDSLPYGSYYAYIFDPCDDTTYKIDSTVYYPFRIQSGAYGNCTFGRSAVGVQFGAGVKKPYSATVYYPDGSVATSGTTSTQNLLYLSFAAYAGPGGTTLKVVAEDGCGKKDTSYVQQETIGFTRTKSVYQKCPGVFGASGSGDLTLKTRTTIGYVTTLPTIIKVDGRDTLINHSFTTTDTAGQNFSFVNLLSGTYIVAYDFSCGGATYYDTVTVEEYVYPTQNADTAIQCGGNQFQFTFSIVGGLAPHTFQVIDNTPAWPSLVTPVQSSPFFSFANGQHYTSVKVRAIDRCGNSTIGDVAVQPINGCSTLPAEWFRNDSSLVNRLVKVFPNPSSGAFTVSISQKKKSNFHLQITNASGIMVYQQQLKNVDRRDVLINQRLAPGLYIVEVQDLMTGKKTVAKQVVW